jgi:hypothetical protein
MPSLKSNRSAVLSPENWSNQNGVLRGRLEIVLSVGISPKHFAIVFDIVCECESCAVD